ncbi:MAG: Rrf2 family transcriptional regulator [Phycisphaeraceae bacterium]|nr:Rrf2 family transcriptional regulator [Phycisphaeraceae bacterium]
MLSQTVEYALRAVVHLAGLKPGQTVNSESIAEQTKVSHGYLAKILRDLVVARLITSQRGPNGGFALARPAGTISMLDVVNAVDPIMRLKECPLGNPLHIELCPLHRRLDNAIGMIEREFQRTMIAEVLETTEQHRKVTPTVRGKKA